MFARKPCIVRPFPGGKKHLACDDERLPVPTLLQLLTEYLLRNALIVDVRRIYDVPAFFNVSIGKGE